ncbi:hypothetical protein C8F01DRAFT_980079, partial [Mycena amicta]
SCSAGSYSNAGATSCTSCPAGSFSNTNGASSCQSCPAGTASAVGASSCASCPAGKYSSNGACTSCPAGMYAGASASSCSSCPANTFSTNGASSCSACPSGLSSLPGSSQCLSTCSAGQYYSGGKCSTCPAGWFSTAGATSCSQSGAVSNAGSTTCTACPGGSVPSSCGPQPSKRAQLPLSNKQTCSRNEVLCPILSGSGGSECINVKTTVDSCGGCVGPEDEAEFTGSDCTTIPNVNEVGCRAGECKIESCRSGFEVSSNGGFCVPSSAKNATSRRHTQGTSMGARRDWL